jgi:excisionase family DNA binding protein
MNLKDSCKTLKDYIPGGQQMQVENERRGYTAPKGAAKFLSISLAGLYKLMSDGQLPYIKIGKSRRIAWAALEELARRNTHGGQAVRSAEVP